MKIIPQAADSELKQRSLARSGIDLWYLNHQHFGEEFIALGQKVLSSEELAQAEHFHPNLKTQYISTRYMTRTILSRYEQSIQPSAWSFKTTTFEKPRIANKSVDLDFNISHSGNCIILAVSRRLSVGVDIEIVNKHLDLGDISRTYLSLPEREYLRKFTDKLEQRNEFFRIWTLKEAVIKAAGNGISIPLVSFSVCNEEVSSNRKDLAGKWHLHNFEWQDQLSIHPVSLAYRAKSMAEVRHLYFRIAPLAGSVNLQQSFRAQRSFPK